MSLLHLPQQPDLEDNKRKRARLKLLWLSSPSAKEAIKKRCAEDFFFWAEHFCFTFEEHAAQDQKVQPLVMYDFQREYAQKLITEYWNCIRDEDYTWNGVADKCRKMTGTFTPLTVDQWFSQFHGVSHAITSKTLDDVDIKGNMDTPFEKLRWQIEQQYKQARFLFPEDFDINDNENYKKRLVNFGNGGKIVGLAPTSEAMRQIRALSWLADEYAWVEDDYGTWTASSAAFKARLLVSTPKDEHCKYHKICFRINGEQVTVFEFDWWLHPKYARNLYRKPDGSFSSPWFDNKVAKNDELTINKEYLRDHHGATAGKVFTCYRAMESSDVNLGPDPRVREIYRIWDPGRCSAVTFGQKDSDGALRCLAEIVVTEKNTPKGEDVLNHIARESLKFAAIEYPNFDVIDIGDPYASRKQIASQKKTEYDLLKENHKINVHSSYMFDIASHERRSKRIQLLKDAMAKTIETTGKPALLINPRLCPNTHEAFRGAYRHPVDDDGTVNENEIIKKHPFNDVVDCFGMLAIKLWYVKSNTNKDKKFKVRKEKINYRQTTRGTKRA